MTLIHELFGTGKDLTALQMSMRAFVFFFLTLIYLRIGGLRTLGRKSASDMVIIIVLGSLLARGISGASGFGATTAASAVLVLIHRFVAWLTVKSTRVENMVNGKKILLFEEGKFITEGMKKANITMNEFLESLRLETQSIDLTRLTRAYMEVNGRISFTKKEEMSK